MVPATTTQCSPTRTCWLRAWDRAKAEALIPYYNQDGTWAVKTYTVIITGSGWSALSCNCPAGRHGRICKHAAVVAKAVAAHVRPIRGTEKAGKGVAVPAAPVPAHIALHIPSPLDALYS